MKVLVAQSWVTLCDPMDCSPLGSTIHRILQAGILEWVAMPFSRGPNPGLRHCRQILYYLSHQGGTRKLEWAAYPYSRGSSQPRD